MSFSAEQTAAVNSLAETFGPFPEANPEHVEPIFINSYERSVRDYAGYIVNHFRAAELAADPELPAIKQRIREEKAKAAAIKNAERAVEVRESLVSGIISGLIPKARKAGQVNFLINDWCINVSVEKNGDHVFGMTYDRGDSTMDAFLDNKEFEIEDWSVMNGNARPRDQSVAYHEIVTYLEGLD